MALATGIGALLSIGGSLFGGRSKKKAMARLQQQAQQREMEQRRLLSSREAGMGGLFDYLSGMQGMYLDQAPAADASSTAALLGLFGAQPGTLRSTVGPSGADMARYEQQYRQLTEPRIHHEVGAIPDDVDPNILARVYDQIDAAHRAKYKGVGLAGSKAFPEYAGNIQNVINVARRDSVAAGYKPRSQQAAELRAPGRRELEYQIRTPEGGDLFTRARTEATPLFAQAQQELADLYAGTGRDITGLFDANPLSKFTGPELDLMRSLARPQERQATQELEDRLFAQGRLGTTGGSEQFGAFQDELNRVDQARILAAMETARGERDRYVDPQLGLLQSRLASNENIVGGKLDFGINTVVRRLKSLADTYSGYYGRAAEQPYKALSLFSDRGNRRIGAHQDYTGLINDAFSQGTQSQLGIAGQRAQQAGSMWDQIGQFGSGLAGAGMYGLFGGGGGGGQSGGDQWAGIPYRSGVTQSQITPWSKRYF